MIIGLGSDLIDIRRIEKSLERFGDRFTNRVFTQIEQAKSDRRRERAASYAKRFAAKEACSKALGTGLSNGVFWRDMGVVNLPSGKPTFNLTNGARKRLDAMMPEGMEAVIHLTITDDFPLAQAFVIIEALPTGVPGQNEIADSMHQSLRTFQRRLKDEGYTFRKLVEEIREDLAVSYLKEPGRSIGEVTYLLGYSEPTNFTRSFKRWTGKSPQEYRADL